jgi:hypothetical protein
MKSLTESALIISELHHDVISADSLPRARALGIEGANNNAVNLASFYVEVSFLAESSWTAT